jgi:anti-sigma regulatory factor (Ser/Thr protein kinase)
MTDPFVHEGLFYRDSGEYLAGMVPFIRTGLSADEPVLVAVPGDNLDLIRDAVGEDAHRVRFRDMALAGRNPGRIIPAVLLAFIAEHAGRRVRIIGEPIWAGRSETEYPACVQHEALINVAVAGRPATILCPYDASRLPAKVLADAEGTHPVLVSGEHRSPCSGYRPPLEIVAEYNTPFLDPAPPIAVLEFGADTLRNLRALVSVSAAEAGLSPERALAAEVAAHELAVNAVEHGDGRGRVRAWSADGTFVCEVTGCGDQADPLAGRRAAPNAAPDRGRGLLLVQSLCDLVRVHTAPGATTTLIYLRL